MENGMITGKEIIKIKKGGRRKPKDLNGSNVANILAEN
jgi:hypothetical protein